MFRDDPDRDAYERRYVQDFISILLINLKWMIFIDIIENLLSSVDSKIKRSQSRIETTSYETDQPKELIEKYSLWKIL